MSTVIDERVVQMRFDNDQFEEGIRDTINDLKKLKESLINADSTKVFGKLDKAAQNIQLSGIAAGVEALQKRFSLLGLIGIKSLNGIADATLNVTKRLYNATLGQIVSGGVKRAMNMENARFQLQALFSKEKNSAELVEQVMKDANAAVDGTAYSLDAAAKAASQFAATGIKAGDEMKEALRGIVGVSAMTNSDFESISMIFTTVAGQGRVMGDQLNQLAARGLNAAATMADFANGVIDGSIKASDEVTALVKSFSTGVKLTEGDIRDLTSKGKISFKLFSEAMTDAFADSAEKANETFTGALSNVKSALSRIGAGFISPLIEQNSKIVLLFNALREKINEFKKTIVFDESIGNVMAVSKQFTDAVLTMAEGLTEFIKYIDVPSIMRDFYYGLETIKNIFKALWVIVKPALMAMSGLMNPIGEAIHTIMVALEAVTSRMIASEGTATALGEVLKSIVEVLGTILTGALKIIQRVFKPMNKESKETTSTLADLLNTVAGLLKGFNKWLQTSPAITKGFNLLADAISTVIRFLGTMGKLVGGGIIIGMDSLARAFGRFMSSIKGSDIAYKTINKIRSAFSSLSKFMSGLKLPNPFKDYTEGLEMSLASVGNYFGRLTGSVNMGSFVKNMESGSTGIGKFVESVKILVSETKPLEKISGAFNTIITVGKGFINFIMDFGSALSGVFVGGGIMYFVNKTLGTLAKTMGIFNSTLNNIGTELVHTLKSVRGALDQSINSLKAYQNNLNASALIKIAGAIAILSGALLLLSFADPKGLLAAAVAIGTVGLVLISGTSILQKAINKSKNVWDALNSFGSEIGKAAKWKAISGALKSVGQAILMITGSIVALAIIYSKDEKNLTKAVGLLAKIGAVIAGFMVVMSLLGQKFGSGMKNFALAASGIMFMAFSLTTVIGAMSKLFKIKLPLDYKRKFAILQALLLEMTAITAVLNLVSHSGKGGKLNTIPIFLLFTSLHSIISALKRLFKMSLPDDWKTKLGILSLIIAELAGLIVALGAANSIAKGKMKSAGSILTMAGFLVTAVGSLALLTLLPMDKLAGAVKTFAIVIGSLSVAILATSKITNADGAKVILSVAIVIGAIVTALSVLTLFDWKDLLKGAVSLGLVLVAMADVVESASKIGTNKMAIVGIAGTILAMLSVAAALYELSGRDWKGMAASGVAMYLAMKGYADAFGALADASQSTITFSQVIKFVAAATAAIPLAAALWIIAKQPWSGMAASGVALGVCLKSYASAFDVMANSTAVDKKQVIKFVVGATAAIPLAAALWVLSNQPWDGITASGIALSACMLSYAKAFEIISKSNAIDLDQVKSFLAASLSVIPIALALGVLAFQPWESLIGAAGSLSATLLAFSACFMILSKTAIPPAGMAQQFVLASVALIPIAIALKIVAGEPWQELIGAAASISLLLLALAGTLKICSLVGAAAGPALIGLGVLAIAIAGLVALIGIIGAVVDAIGAEDSIISGLEILKKISTGLGEAIGGFIYGIGEGLTSGLYNIADNLSLFMEHLQPFIEGCHSLTPEALSGVMSLGSLIASLTKADVIQGIQNFLGGDASFANLGEQLVAMAPFLRTFADSVTGIDPSSVEGAAAAADIISKMAAALPREGGWIDSILGSKKTLAQFAQELLAFGPAIKSFSIIAGGIDPSSVEGAAAAGRIMAELASTLPASDGWIQKVFGDKTLSEFGEELMSFGPNIRDFAEIVKDVKPEAVEGAAAAGNIMASLAENIPNSGGVLGWIMGNNDIDDFGEDLVSYGNSMVAFAEIVRDLNPMDLMGVGIATQMMISLSQALPEKSGLIGLITGGKMDFKKFGTQLEKFGNSMVKFSGSVAGVDLGVVQLATDSLSRILDLMIRMDGVNPESLTAFGTALNNLSTLSLQEFITNFQNGSVLVIGEVQKLFTDINSTIQTSLPLVISVIKMGIDGTVLATNMYLPFAFASVKTSMISIGQFVGEGLSIGLLGSMESVKTAARQLGDAIKTTTASALEEHSPSKAAQSMGDFWGQGLVKGLEGGIGIVKKASELLAVKGIQTPIRDVLGIHSPAAEGEYDGLMMCEGEASGLRKGIGTVEKAANEVGKKAKDILGKRAEQAADYMAKKASDEWGDTVYEVYDGIKKTVKGENEELEQQVEENSNAVINASTKTKKKAVTQEKGYWEELLKIKQAGIDGAKYKEMDLKKFQETTLSEALNVWESYTNELSSKRDNIMSSMDIFSEVEKKETVSKEKMKQNIEDQIKAYDEYIQTMVSLNARLGDSEFGNYVRDMGVDSLDQLKVINSMSDEELTNFVDLYDTKMVYATQAAAQQLTVLQAETESKLASLFGGMADSVNVFDFGKVFDGSFESIDEYVQGVMLPLQESNRKAREEASQLGGEITGGVTDGLDESGIDQVINEPLFEAFEVARGDQLDNAKTFGKEIGEYMFEGVGEGMSVGAFEDAAAQMMVTAEKNLREAGEIHSPSELMRREVGPYITEGVAEGMIDAIPSVNDSITQIVAEIVNTFSNNIQDIRESAGTVATAIQNGIGDKAPMLMNDVRNVSYNVIRNMNNIMSNSVLKKIGIDMMNSLHKGLRSKSYTVLDFVREFCEKVMEAFETGLDKLKIETIGLSCIEALNLGLSSNTEMVAETASQVCKTVVGVFEHEMDQMRFAGIGVNAVAGLLLGTQNGMIDVNNATEKIANGSINTARKVLDEHSPSRVFFEIGKYIPMGLAKGITGYLSSVVNASEKMSKQSGNAIKNAIFKIHNIITDDTFNDEITIRPLVDLSNVEASRKQIAKMFNAGVSAGFSGNIGSVGSSFDSYKNPKVPISSGSQTGSNGGNTVNNFNFNQNNYSPEALSAIDIYRQTKNQINMLKQKLG